MSKKNNFKVLELLLSIFKTDFWLKKLFLQLCPKLLVLPKNHKEFYGLKFIAFQIIITLLCFQKKLYLCNKLHTIIITFTPR
jgi:hypothetical protein